MSGPHRPGRLGDLFEAAGERPGEQRVLVVLGVAGLALALILAAFLVGRGLAQSAAQTDEPSAGTGSAPRAQAAAHPATAPNGRLLGRSYQGAVRPATVRVAHAGCRAEPSVDAGGNRVTYPAANMLDGRASTAWRCTGDGRGVTLTFSLRHAQPITQVGLVPGYAKTDRFSGDDRYAENRRIARVRWGFDGGAWVEQTFATGPGDRGVQTMRIPPVRTHRVTVTIQDSVPASRNTVAVSTVHLGAPRR